MAELNPGLILGYQGPQIATPQEQQYKKARLQEALNANDINRMKIDEYQAGKERSNALKNILATTDPNQLPNALLKGGFLDEASKYQKNQTDNQSALAGIEKTKFETQKEKTRAIGQAMGFLKDNPSLENLQATLSGLVNQGYMTPEQAQQAIQNGPQDPQGIATLATRHFQSALDADKQLAKYETRDAGGSVETLQINPVTGKIATVNSINKTQSPDSIANNLRMKEEGAANRAVTVRGQNLNDARGREANAIAKAKGPNEKLTEGMRSTGQYAARMVAAEKLLDQTTEQKPGVLETIAGGTPFIGNEISANLARSPDRQKALQAQRDWVRAKLRKESGAVIGEQEMKDEISTYFPQIGDSAEVIAQKAVARQQAVDGMIGSAGGAYEAPNNAILPKGATMGSPSKVVDFGDLK